MATHSSVYESDTRTRVEALFALPGKAEPADDITTWRARPLPPHYALVFFDSLLVKLRENGLLKNKRLHLALGVAEDGTKDIIGFWLEHPMAEHFWPDAVAELQRRGLALIDIAVTNQSAADKAIRCRFPATLVGSLSLHLLPPALRALCASTSAVGSVIEKRRRRGLIKHRSFASGEAAVRDLLLVLQDANTGWKVSPARWAAAKAELVTLRHALKATL